MLFQSYSPEMIVYHLDVVGAAPTGDMIDPSEM